MIEINGNKVKTVLITGIAGLIGYNFAQYLLSRKNKEYMVVGIDAMEDWGNDNALTENEYYKFYKINCSSEEIDKIFEVYKFDIVYHFAAYAAEWLSPFIRKFNYENNIISTANIINKCIKYKVGRLVYTSSMSVYGHGIKPGRKFNEDDIPSPIDPYAISKYACELDIKAAGEQHGLDWCIIRPHNVFGIGQNVNDKYRNVIGIWMHQLITGEPMTIYGSGDQTRAFTVADNICTSLFIAGTSKKASKQIINLGGEKTYSINEAADIFSYVIGVSRDRFKYAEARYEVKHAVPTNDKAKKLLEYSELITFEEGMKTMWDWVLKEQKVKEWYKWDNFDIYSKLYSYWKQ